MPIFVTTGGPVESGGGDTGAGDTGAGVAERDIVSQISDELDDTENAYLPQIQNAVAAAIRFCAREPFYFNQNIEIAFCAQPGRTGYSAEDTPALAQLGAVRAAWRVENGQSFPLRRETAENLRQMQSGAEAEGAPQFFGFFGQTLCLHPAPCAPCAIRLLLDAAAPASGAVPWLGAALGLIKARAKYDLYKDILKDAPAAAAAFADFREEWALCAAESSRRANVARLRPTQF